MLIVKEEGVLREYLSQDLARCLVGLAAPMLPISVYPQPSDVLTSDVPTFLPNPSQPFTVTKISKAGDLGSNARYR